jgi:carbamate kinase
VGASRIAVVALGGNALIADPRHQSFEDQASRMRMTAVHIADMLEAGWDLILTHGNGPQVGYCLLSSELASSVVDETPMEVCVADTQGSLGYLIQQGLRNELRGRGIGKQIVTVVTQVLVDANDPAFQHPTKPVGSWYGEEEARRLASERGWQVAEDAGRGWRRVVPSPRPQEILEVEAIQTLARSGFIVIGAGGGGIPVVCDEAGELRGVAAVIDKDHASALLGVRTKADLLLISTGVERVAIHFRTPQQRDLSEITVAEAERYLSEGHFAAGSMQPKIEASIKFVRETGKPAVITSPEAMGRALKGETGTRIVSG